MYTYFVYILYIHPSWDEKMNALRFEAIDRQWLNTLPTEELNPGVS